MDEKGHAKFPFYWNRFSKRVLSVDYYSLSSYDQVVLGFLYKHLTSEKKVLSWTNSLKWDTNRVEVLNVTP